MSDLREIVAQAIHGAPFMPSYHGDAAEQCRRRALAKADAVLAALSASIGEDVRKACLSVFKPAIHGGMQVPTVAGAWIPVCTAALDSLLDAWGAILALAARDAALEEAAEKLDAEARGADEYASHATMPGAVERWETVATEHRRAAAMTRALKGGPNS
jgi:hypothetical protein